MAKSCTDHDIRRLVSALVAGVMTSGALVTGALTMAPVAVATCDAAGAEASCPGQEDPEYPPGPTQAEIDAATKRFQSAQAEEARLKAAYKAANDDFDTYVLSDEPGHKGGAVFNDKYLTMTDRGKEWEASVREYREAEKLVKTLTEKAELAGPSRAEVDDANSRFKAAQAEESRLKAAYKAANDDFDAYVLSDEPGHNGGAVFNDKYLTMRDRGKEWEASVREYRDAEGLVKTLADRAANVPKKREAKELAGPSQAEIDEANRRFQAAQAEDARLKAAYQKAQDDFDAYFLSDEPGHKGGAVFNDKYLTMRERGREWEAIGPEYREAEKLVKTLTEKAAAAAKKREAKKDAEWLEKLKWQGVSPEGRAAEEEAERQLEKQVAKALTPPTPEEIGAATKDAAAARDEATRLTAALDKAKRELEDVGKTVGTDTKDTRYQEKLRAYHDANDLAKSAQDKAALADSHEAALRKKVEKAAARRAARELQDREKAERLANPTRLDHLRIEASRAFLELRDAAKVYGSQSKDPRYLDKLKAYEEADKAFNSQADADEAAKKQAAQQDSDAATQKHDGTESTNGPAKTDEATSVKETGTPPTGKGPDGDASAVGTTVDDKTVAPSAPAASGVNGTDK